MTHGTLDELVKLTGFSKTTISRVINGKSKDYRISESTSKAILKAADEINFRPNVIAQSLRNKKTYTIGVIVPYIKNFFFANLASSIIVEAKQYGYTVMLIDTQEDEHEEENALSTMLARGIDGVIIVPCSQKPDILQKYSKLLPIVLVDRYFKNIDIPYVSTNNFQGSCTVMKMLLEAGHKRILCIQGPPRSMTTIERIRGCKETITNYDTARLIIGGNAFSIQNGYIETKLALNLKEPPTAIFALSNTILLGAIEAIKEHGLSIPNDISIASFDNSLYLNFMNPPITRIAQPIDTMGSTAIKMLIKMVEGNYTPQNGILIDPTLIMKESVKIIK